MSAAARRMPSGSSRPARPATLERVRPNRVSACAVLALEQMGMSTSSLRPATLIAVAALSLSGAGAAEGAIYYGTVGPERVISLTTRSGASVVKVAAGRHTFVIRDRSPFHNFVLTRGRTRLRWTTLDFAGTVRWTVRIRTGATYKYFCASHRRSMNGSFRVG